jgi:putative oxidoreductase
MKRLSSLAPQILGVMRILVGVMFACHGAQKLLGAFGGVPAGSPPVIIWSAGLVELIGGPLITVGLFARGAAFVASGLMAFAYFMAHASHGFWPISNGGELAIVYCWFFLYLAAHGPGAFALSGTPVASPNR